MIEETITQKRREWIKDKESIVNSGSEGENVQEEFAVSKCFKRKWKASWLNLNGNMTLGVGSMNIREAGDLWMEKTAMQHFPRVFLILIYFYFFLTTTGCSCIVLSILRPQPLEVSTLLSLVLIFKCSQCNYYWNVILNNFLNFSFQFMSSVFMRSVEWPLSIQYNKTKYLVDFVREST